MTQFPEHLLIQNATSKKSVRDESGGDRVKTYEAPKSVIDQIATVCQIAHYAKQSNMAVCRKPQKFDRIIDQHLLL